MNPDDKFRGAQNFHQRQADNKKVEGSPADHQRPRKPRPAKTASSPKSISTPRPDPWMSIVPTYLPTHYSKSLSDTYNRLMKSMTFTGSFMFTTGTSTPDPRFSGKEFAASSVKGARSFRIDALGRLTGVAYMKVWKPGENLYECLAETPHKDGKYPDCRCGFYGYYEGSNDFHEGGYASAVVEGYGDAVIGTSGFRSTKARILALTINDAVPAALARLVRRNYSEIPMFESFSRMLSEFPTDYELDEKPIASPDEPDFWTRNA